MFILRSRRFSGAAAALKKNRVFRTLDDKSFKELVAYVERQARVVVQAGEPICADTHVENQPFLVESGTLEVRAPQQQGVVLAKLLPGDVSGFLSLLRTRISRASTWVGAAANADQPAVVYKLNKQEFDGLLRTRPSIALALLRQLSSVDINANTLHGGADQADDPIQPEALARPDAKFLVIRCAMFDVQPYMQEAFEKALRGMQKEMDERGVRVEFTYTPHNLSQKTVSLASGAEAVCTFINDEVDGQTAALLRRQGVSIVALRCAGTERIDVGACDALNVSVVRVPQYSSHSVPEYAVGMVLSLIRKIHTAVAKTRVGDFQLSKLVGFDLHGKTVGILGTGLNGTGFANIMRGHGCRVLCYDRVINDELKKLPGVTYASLRQVLSESDIVSLHLPLTPETKHIIDADSLAVMKKGAVLVNCARGGLVDTAALLDALQSKKLMGACLDVYERETGYFHRDWSGEVIADTELAALMNHPHVLLSSHQAFLTEEGLGAIATTTIRNLIEYGEGNRLGNLSNSVNKRKHHSLP